MATSVTIDSNSANVISGFLLAQIQSGKLQANAGAPWLALLGQTSAITWRKMIQVIPVTFNASLFLVALADDGTLWYGTIQTVPSVTIVWAPLPSIPQQ